MRQGDSPISSQQIREQCKIAIAHPHLGGVDAKIRLVIPGQWGNSNRKLLIKAKGAPFGEIISDADDKHVLVAFSAKEVLDWLEHLSAPTKIRNLEV
jgi:hypothetical protein